MSIMEYINNLNAENTNMDVTAIENVEHRPICIEIRFVAIAYKTDRVDWKNFVFDMKEASHLTAFISTNEEMFQNGIIEIKLSSQNHNFEEGKIVETLRFMVKYLEGIKKVQSLA